jgi:hypothetical protein
MDPDQPHGSGSDTCFVPHEIVTVHYLVECLDGREDLVKGALLQMVVVHTVQDNIHHIRQQLLIQTLFKHRVTEYSRANLISLLY